MIYQEGMTFICERCGKLEEEIDHPENLFDFHYKYGHNFCESCMEYWITSSLYRE